MKIKANLDSAAASVIAKSVVEANDFAVFTVFDSSVASFDEDELTDASCDESGIVTFSLSGGTSGLHVADVLLCGVTEDDVVAFFATEGLNAHLLPHETQTLVLDLKKAEQKWSPNAVFEVGDDGVSVGTPASKEWAEDNFKPLA